MVFKIYSFRGRHMIFLQNKTLLFSVNCPHTTNRFIRNAVTMVKLEKKNSTTSIKSQSGGRLYTLYYKLINVQAVKTELE